MTLPSAVVTVGGTRRQVRVGEYLVVGTSGGSDLRVKHPYVSRRHALIGYKDGWFIEDLGSSNGTFVDGQQVARTPLGGATEVMLGDPNTGLTMLVTPDVHSGATPTPAAAPAEMSLPVEGILNALPLPPRRGVTPGWADTRPAVPMIPPPPLGGTSIGRAPQASAIGGAPLAIPAPPPSGGLAVRDVLFTVDHGKVLVDEVSINAERGTLTAVVGPSGAGKSTFASLISGVNKPSGGSIVFDGIDVVGNYASAKERIGLVPQDDVIHRGLKLGTALRFAAKLRLPGWSESDRQNQVNKAVAQLDLEPHLNTRIGRLSGGQRKRASVAMELLTEPDLLILDEPTSGLDPALDRQLMHEFRKLANGGRTVLVITHSVAHLDICDQILVLAPGGKTAFVGPEPAAMTFFDTSDWSDVFGTLQTEPQIHTHRWRQTRPALPDLPASAAALGPSSRPVSGAKPPGQARNGSRGTFTRQLATLISRQVALLVADRGYTAFLLVLPFVIGFLPAVTPGDTGLTQVQTAQNSQEPTVILALLIIGALFMGVSMSIRDIIGEKSIFLRERAVGLSPAAYLLSKILVLGLLSWIGAGIIIGVMALVKDLPTGKGVLGIGATTELFITLGVTVSVGMILGLLLSSLVTSQNQAMPVLVVVLMIQMVMNGGLISLTGNTALNIASYFTPARWAYAMGAVSIDLPGLLTVADEGDRAIVESMRGDIDAMWTFDTAHWMAAFGVLMGMAAVFAAATWVRLRTMKR